MAEILREVIDAPSAWVNASKEDFLYQLTDRQIDALERLVGATRHKNIQDVTRQDFSDPVIDELRDDVLKELRDGRGAIVLSGLSPDRFTPDDYERIYWGFGTNLGKAVIQNYLGDLITYVQDEPDKDNPYDTRTKGRGYRNANEAGYHTDTNEIVGLMCVERAERGGESVISSAVSAHNDFVRNHPELLDAMVEGHYNAIGEDEVLTNEKNPVFAYPDGRLSIYVQWRAMELAATKRGEPFPAELKAAKEYFNERAKANEAEFLLEPGEILLWNNRNHVHGRRKFENSATRKRLLLRLWLEPDHPLPVPANSAEHLKVRIREADMIAQAARSQAG